jgi:hypothetical protein
VSANVPLIWFRAANLLLKFIISTHLNSPLPFQKSSKMRHELYQLLSAGLLSSSWVGQLHSLIFIWVDLCVCIKINVCRCCGLVTYFQKAYPTPKLKFPNQFSSLK